MVIFTRKSFDKAFIENVNSMGLNRTENFKLSKDTNYKQKELKLWYEGDSHNIEKFYKTVFPHDRFLYRKNFYAKVNTGDSNNIMTLYHYNLPNIITSTMVNLLFDKEPDVVISTGSKRNDLKINEVLDKVLYENDFKKLLQTAAEYESYSGGVAFKFVIDTDFSDYPIIIPYPKENIEVVKKYDRIQEIVFKDYYSKGNKKYTLCSIYGRGYINYKLYEQDSDKEVKLTELEETSNLKNIIIKSSNGQKSKRLMAIYKENQVGEKSDYDGVIDEFISMDQLYSSMMDLTEKSAVQEYIPESLCERDIKTDQVISPNNWNRRTVLLHDSNYEGTEQKAFRDVVDISNTLNAYKEAMNNILVNCLITSGLSPSTAGLDVSGANSSALALSIREKTSLKTRNSKIMLWTPFLEDLALLVIDYVSMSSSGDSYIIPEFDAEVNVKFSEYESFERLNELTDMLSKTKDAGLMDLDTALDILNKEFYHKSDEELEIMKMNITNQIPDPEPVEPEVVDTEVDDMEDDEMKENDDKKGTDDINE